MPLSQEPSFQESLSDNLEYEIEDGEISRLENQKIIITDTYYNRKLLKICFDKWSDFLNNYSLIPNNGAYIYSLLKWIIICLRIRPRESLPDKILSELQLGGVTNTILNRISINNMRYKKLIKAYIILRKWRKLHIFNGWFNITHSIAIIRRKVY